jgi:iron uptake system component EfeO
MSRALVVLAAALAVLPAAGCGSSGGSSGSGDGGTPITVTSTSDACTLSSTTAVAGPVTFTVTNDGTEATEFYVYAQDGERIIAEVENIGPALSRDLTVVLEPGSYVTACKPGMIGDGIRTPFTATGSSTRPSGDAAALDAAATEYKVWVASEAAALLAGTMEFVAAVKDGDQQEAKELYAPVRVHWERIEPVAESFGDLDPKLDARENDVEPGDDWTGWHRIEKALWVDESLVGMAPIADQMQADTEELIARIATVELTADQVTNGAKELLDEVANGKVTGEEERYSHTDLWDFQANVDGAKKAYDVVASIVAAQDPELKKTLDTTFADLQEALAVHRVGDGFVLYTDLTDAQVRELAAKVEALSEPLSQLTVTVVS